MWRFVLYCARVISQAPLWPRPWSRRIESRRQANLRKPYMRRAATDLANLSDESLFQEISEGISHIIENAVDLDEAASCLWQAEKYRAAEIISGFAEEEAVKVLILIDVVRCPRSNQSEKVETLKCFYDHLAKKIYSKMCSYRINSFEEAREIIEIERRPFYLDGPRDVDWIFFNSIQSERENSIYVNYVQDITKENGPHFWSCPLPSDSYLPKYRTPASVNVARAICNVGAGTPKGLAIIADIWRGFEPTPKTSDECLKRLKVRTLERLNEEGLYVSEDSNEQLIIANWSFPLWSLTIRLDKGNLKELRSDREDYIRWIEETEAKRDPPPVIPRDKVEALSDAYRKWETERDEKGMITDPDSKIKKFRIGFDSYKLLSFKKLERIFQELTEQERIDLLALAWFTRDRIANWPNVYERARTMVEVLNYKYQIGLGNDWLMGLERWEAKPSGFQPGRFY